MKIDRYTIPLIFAFLGFLLYSNTLHGPFILDDKIYILDNYHNQTAANFFKDLSSARYIGLLTFAINYYFGGLNTFGYHLVNVIIHIINAMLVYVLIQAMGYRQWAVGNRENPSPIASRLLPIACSLIFLVHPIQTQAVSYITQRFTSLATLFYLLSLVLYIKARGKGQEAKGEGLFTISLMPYAFSLFSATLAMKTKEISFTLPFIIMLYELTFFRHDGLRIRTRLLYLAPFFLTLLIIPAAVFWPKNIYAPGADIGEIIRQLQIRDIKTVPMYEYFITQFRVIVTYTRLMVLPINQNFFYDYSLSHSIFEPATFLSFVFLLIIFSSVVYLYFRSRITHHAHGLLISFGILWFFITLSVESSIIPIKDVIFEHRVYLPSVGFILSAAGALFYGFDYLERKTKKNLCNYLLLVVMVISILLSFSAYKRNMLWSDSYLMFLDAVNKAPNRADAHVNLGVVYSEQGQLDKAIAEYLIALRLEPNFVLAHNGLGFAYARQGRFDEAMKEYLIALRLKPDDIDTHYNLGNFYFNQGRLDEAITEYLTALKLQPFNPKFNYGLGVVYYSKGFMDKAVEYFLTALKLRPDYPEALYNIGSIYYRKGSVDKAITHFEAAVKLKPDYVEAYNNLGITYYNKGWVNKAFESFQTAVRLKPADPESRYNIGLVYLEKGLKYRAVAEFETALKLKPDFTEARQALDRLYGRP